MALASGFWLEATLGSWALPPQLARTPLETRERPPLSHHGSSSNSRLVRGGVRPHFLSFSRARPGCTSCTPASSHRSCGRILVGWCAGRGSNPVPNDVGHARRSVGPPGAGQRAIRARSPPARRGRFLAAPMVLLPTAAPSPSLYVLGPGRLAENGQLKCCIEEH